MEKIEKFLVVKIIGGKIFLGKRMGRGFVTDVISLRSIQQGSRNFFFNRGDIVSAVENGSVTTERGTLHFWRPIDTEARIKNLIISGKTVDGFRIAETGELIDNSLESRRAKVHEEWECAALEIKKDRVIYSPIKRIASIEANIEKIDGRVYFMIQRKSGDKVLSVVKRIPAICDTDGYVKDGKVVIRERFLFPLHKFDYIESGSQLVKVNQIPGVAASYIEETREEITGLLSVEVVADGKYRLGVFNSGFSDDCDIVSLDWDRIEAGNKCNDRIG